jgi:hypothetical protein
LDAATGIYGVTAIFRGSSTVFLELEWDVGEGSDLEKEVKAGKVGIMAVRV